LALCEIAAARTKLPQHDVETVVVNLGDRLTKSSWLAKYPILFSISSITDCLLKAHIPIDKPYFERVLPEASTQEMETVPKFCDIVVVEFSKPLAFIVNK
jgi:hypothetical protein